MGALVEFKRLSGLTERPGLAEARGSAADEVYHQLSDDFPASAMTWIKKVHWDPARQIPLNKIDFGEKATWSASKHPTKVANFAKKISKGLRKPVILAKIPGQDKYIAIDGHHRLLAYLKLGMPALAYVAHIKDEGLVQKAEELHSSQKHGPSIT